MRSLEVAGGRVRSSVLISYRYFCLSLWPGPWARIPLGVCPEIERTRAVSALSTLTSPREDTSDRRVDRMRLLLKIGLDGQFEGNEMISFARMLLIAAILNEKMSVRITNGLP